MTFFWPIATPEILSRRALLELCCQLLVEMMRVRGHGSPCTHLMAAGIGDRRTRIEWMEWHRAMGC